MKFLALGDRLRFLREQQSLSRPELAIKSGLSEQDLQAFESGEELPKIAALIQLSKALKVNVADFFRDRPQDQAYEVVRRDERKKVSPFLQASKARIKDYTYEPLTLPGANKHLDAYLIEVPPRQSRKPYDDLTHAGEEFFYVLKGKLRGEFAGESVEMEEGDSIYFRSQTPHCLYNPYDERAQALVVIYPF